MDPGKLSFTPAVEISRIRPKHQKYIAVSIEGQQSSTSRGRPSGSVTEEMKNDIGTVQRQGITATTLEGILAVKGQSHRRR